MRRSDMEREGIGVFGGKMMNKSIFETAIDSFKGGIECEI